MRPAVQALLEDMLSYAEGAVSLVERHGRDGIDAEWGLQQGLIKAVEVVGEAAWSIPKDERPPLTDVPWDQIAGMRHHLGHGYRAIRMDVLFNVVERRLPGLITELKRVLQEVSE